MAKTEPILKEHKLSLAEDFFALKELGLSFVQKLSGEIWTDYNAHDPGVTILEQLCFGLTDIAFRVGFSMQDILATPPKGKIDWKKNSFHSPSKVFSHHPVTINDHRKMIIDAFEEIQNAWLYPINRRSKELAIKGLYKLEIMPSLAFSKSIVKDPKIENEFLSRLDKFLKENRNLCEDFDEILLLKSDPFVLGINLEIDEDLDPNRIFAQLLFDIEKYLYQPISYSSFEELMHEGQSLEQIFSGPRLLGGFIKSTQMKARAEILQVEAFQWILSKVAGVKKSWNLVLNGEEEVKSWPVKNGFYANLKTNPSDPDSVFQTIKVYMNGNRQTINPEFVGEIVLELWSKAFRHYQLDQFKDSFLEEKLKGRFRNLENYTSIQHHFPMIYGIGKEGLSSRDPLERKAKANQLKGYLMLMEQLMGNYLSQLANFSDLLDPKIGINGPSYFSQKLKSVVNFSQFERETDPHEESHDPIIDHLSGENLKDKLDRKIRIFDHLLARFGEEINELPFKISRKLHIIPSEYALKESLIQAKVALLQRIENFNHQKNKGQNLGAIGWKSLSGLEELIYVKSGIKFQEKSLLDGIPINPYSREGMDISDTNSIKDRKEFEQEYRSLSGQEWEELLLPSESGVLSFGKINVKSLFSNPLNPDCYLIRRKKNLLGNWEILFQKAPNNWLRIWEGRNKKDGFSMVAATIQKIKLLNEDTEGFYLLDHILLRDCLKETDYGFYLTDSYGDMTFYSNWCKTEQERQELLKEFYRSAMNSSNFQENKAELILKNEQGKTLAKAKLHSLGLSDNGLEKLKRETKEQAFMMAGSPEDQGVLLLKEIEKIRLHGTIHNDRKVYQKRVVLSRRLANEEIISEDFFDLKLSLVFPNWPARFQEKHFRFFMENLVKESVPIHSKVQVYWKNLLDIQEFESHYLEWKNLVKKDGKDDKVKLAALNLYKLIRQWENADTL
ncbi:hypothetical protein JYB64_08700 [Algoriphagus aestuarii]|nr:hypothetical protein [Algoriphagus aestuarii]